MKSMRRKSRKRRHKEKADLEVKEAKRAKELTLLVETLYYLEEHIHPRARTHLKLIGLLKTKVCGVAESSPEERNTEAFNGRKTYKPCIKNNASASNLALVVSFLLLAQQG